VKASDLYVVGAYSNPRRYETPLKLCRKWITDTLDSGVNVTLVEHAFGERPYAFDPAEFPQVNIVQVRGGAEHELWLQHALYNRGIATLPDSANYICWQDTDVKHMRSDWAVETVHMLQHHRVGQTWTHSYDLDPSGNITPNEWNNWVDRSFCAAYLAGEVDPQQGPYGPTFCRALLPECERDWRSHTGYSWAIRRDALKGLGRLLDWLVLGSGDYHMAHGFAGNLRQMAENGRAKNGEDGYTAAYYRKLVEFSDLCERFIEKDLGCAPGTLQHGWHGSKRLRFYGGREDVLRESAFDPDHDITYDFNGLPTLCSSNHLLRDGIRRYNTRRNADCIRVD
jgi:hypothetical protein